MQDDYLMWSSWYLLLDFCLEFDIYRASSVFAKRWGKVKIPLHIWVGKREVKVWGEIRTNPAPLLILQFSCPRMIREVISGSCFLSDQLFVFSELASAGFDIQKSFVPNPYLYFFSDHDRKHSAQNCPKMLAGEGKEERSTGWSVLLIMHSCSRLLFNYKTKRLGLRVVLLHLLF